MKIIQALAAVTVAPVKASAARVTAISLRQEDLSGGRETKPRPVGAEEEGDAIDLHPFIINRYMSLPSHNLTEFWKRGHNFRIIQNYKAVYFWKQGIILGLEIRNQLIDACSLSVLAC